MKELKLVLESCKGCPYLTWEENNGCGNYAGWSHCNKKNQHIERNTMYPEFPVWCPLTDKPKA